MTLAFVKNKQYHSISPLVQCLGVVLLLTCGYLFLTSSLFYMPFIWQHADCKITSIQYNVSTAVSATEWEYSAIIILQLEQATVEKHVCKFASEHPSFVCAQQFVLNETLDCTFSIVQRKQIYLYQDWQGKMWLWLVLGMLILVFDGYTLIMLFILSLIDYSTGLGIGKWRDGAKVFAMPRRVPPVPAQHATEFAGIPANIVPYVNDNMDHAAEEQILWHEKPPFSALVGSLLRNAPVLAMISAILPFSTIIFLAMVSYLPYLLGFALAWVVFVTLFFLHVINGKIGTMYVMTNKRAMVIELALLKSNVYSMEYANMTDLQVAELDHGAGKVYWGIRPSILYASKFYPFATNVGFEYVSHLDTVTTVLHTQRHDDEEGELHQAQLPPAEEANN